jgi:hypothetical protein
LVRNLIIAAGTGQWKFLLQSYGVVSGVAFGVLGFALFLIGAKGDTDAAFDDSQHKVQLTRMAPGSLNTRARGRSDRNSGISEGRCSRGHLNPGHREWLDGIHCRV